MRRWLTSALAIVAFGGLAAPVNAQGAARLVGRCAASNPPVTLDLIEQDNRFVTLAAHGGGLTFRGYRVNDDLVIFPMRDQSVYVVRRSGAFFHVKTDLTASRLGLCEISDTATVAARRNPALVQPGYAQLAIPAPPAPMDCAPVGLSSPPPPAISGKPYVRGDRPLCVERNPNAPTSPVIEFGSFSAKYPHPSDARRTTVSRVGLPLLISEEDARQCQLAGTSSDAITNCMVSKMLSTKSKKAYDCARTTSSSLETARCVAQAYGGEREREYIDVVEKCRQQAGDALDKLPVCIAKYKGNKEMSTAAGCIEKERSKKRGPSIGGFGACYALASMEMNEESQVAVDCALATGGVPAAFATCTGGELTGRELQKCLDHGIGGENGCFGPNNSIVVALRGLGIDTASLLNPNGEVIKITNTALNDIAHGPGENNEFIKVGRAIANAIGFRF